jgi:trimethylamine-N-oxide reductase (cytochrome c)
MGRGSSAICDELKRVNKQYGSEAVLVEADMHAEGKHVYPSHGCMARLLSLLGDIRFKCATRTAGKAGSGARSTSGAGSQGRRDGPHGQPLPGYRKEQRYAAVLGLRPENDPNAHRRLYGKRLCYWLSELGIKSVYVCPDLNYGAACMRQWIPYCPTHDAALYLAIIYVWLSEGIYDKEYVKTHVVGYEEFFDYVLREGDGEPKTPSGPR